MDRFDRGHQVWTIRAYQEKRVDVCEQLQGEHLEVLISALKSFDRILQVTSKP